MYSQNLFYIFAFFVMIMQSGVSVNSNQKYDRMWKKTKENCERTACSHYAVKEESYNCVNKCASDACYDQIYASEPLEDGEIDMTRSRQFTNCLRKEAKASKKKK